MNNTKFTLFDLLYDIVEIWSKVEKKEKGSIVGNLLNTIEKKGKLRDAQYKAVKIYLWLKEKGNNKKLSELIKNGTPFVNDKIIFYSGDEDYKDKPAKRYRNRYLQDAGIKNLDEYLRVNLPYESYEKLIDNLFEDFDYPNYLFSLPMGAGKTFLMAIFIYIDLYMLLKTKDESKYSKNFIIIAPSSRKTAILPALKTIKLFNPKWILPNADADKIKRLIKIEVLDEIAKSDKLQNQNPNLAKINRTINGHSYGNVFILNAEKVIPDNSVSKEEFDNMPLAQQTRIKRAESIKETISNLENIQVFLDEAHHSYSSDKETKKLRQQLDVINKNNNIKCCIGMSGTPYIDRKVNFNDKVIKLQDIQDIVYYYPLTDAIGNFLKTPIIKRVDSDELLLINSSLNDFFNNYDIRYENDTLSKIAFYCPSIEKLNEEILPVIYKWYEDNGRDKNEILCYYTNNNKEYTLPKENLIHFLNLDNPTSKHRVILLVAVGTEGWDCRSLTAVVLHRQKSSKNFVLQTTCRCLREVCNAQKEKALIYLDISNYEILDNELNTNYHLRISDINGKELDVKEYPVYKIKENLGKVTYKNVYTKYTEIIEKNINTKDFKKLLLQYDFEKFKTLHPFRNEIGTTTITSTGLNETLTFKQLENISYKYNFIDFIYELESSTYGAIACNKLIKYEKELRRIFNIIKEDFSWIANHPDISTFDVCKDITSIFANKVKCKSEEIVENIEFNLLNWDMETKPTVRVSEKEKNLIFPENAYDDIEDSEFYEDNLKEIKRRYNDKMKIPNKEKSFNYLPYKMDSSYEINFLKNVLRNISDLDIEIYYNGYKNSKLENLTIITPYGNYTPDFLMLKRDNKKEIIKILLIETKAEPYKTEAIENFIKTTFLKNNPNYSYIKIGDTENDKNEYNKLIDVIKTFVSKDKI